MSIFKLRVLVSGTEGGQTTVWHGMPEAKFDTEEVER